VSEGDEQLSQERNSVEVEIEELDNVVTEEETENSLTKHKSEIKVAVVGQVAKEIIAKANEALVYTDYEIVPVSCDDYNRPNELVLSGEVDACLCDNYVFLESYNKKNTTELVIVERLYYEPLAVFGGNVENTDSLVKGAKVAVPKGEVLKARSLYLLEQKGLLEINEEAYYQATLEDIVSNPLNLTIEEIDFDAGWPDSSEYGLIICDYNRAMLHGISPDDSLGDENRNSDLTDMFAACVVTDNSKENSPKIKQLSKALNSDEVEDYIEETYYGAVVDYR